MGESEKFLYNPKDFVCTDLNDYKQYFDGYKRLVGDFKEFLVEGLKDFSMDDLEKECSTDHLERTIPQKQPHTLSTTRLINLEVNNDMASEFKVVQCKQMYAQSMRKTYPCAVFNQQVPPDDYHADLTPSEDYMYTVKMYDSYRIRKRTKRRYADTQRCMQDINVLAGQTLADLRDKLLCTNDLGFSIEIEYPVIAEPEDVKDAYPSGFFFIENCFYNDMRHERAVDYSKTIISWAGRKSAFPKFKSALMETTKLQDIKLRLGYPYLYQHRGDCEHLIVFSDARLLGPEDTLSSAAYPYVKFDYPSNCTNCFMCGHRVARYLITNSDRIPHKLGYFCRECVLAYNYIGDQKVGSFKLYPYFDRTLDS